MLLFTVVVLFINISYMTYSLIHVGSTNFCSSCYSSFEKFRVSKFFFFKEMNTFIQQGCIKLIKCDSKTLNKSFLMLQKISISNKCSSFILSVYQNILIKGVSTKIWSITTVFNIDNTFSWAAHQHIIMISEGSCDTEDWNNDAKNSDLITEINYILKHIQIENSYFKLW